MILSKSCHDTDILRWLIGKPSRRISSFGSLSLFRPDRAPVGAPRRCTDGCPVEAECPFSALKVYLEPDSPWAAYLVTADRSEAGLRKALQDGPYGRCVYYCDNDAVDHQVTNIEFDDGVTAAFSLEGLTSYGGRRTRITGTRGDLTGDELTLSVFDFATRKTCEWTQPTQQSGHGGGDFGLVHDFVRAVAGQDASILSSTIDASMESHLMGFMAEKSRLNHGEVQEILL
jgi:predicted dehydrogenase